MSSRRKTVVGVVFGGRSVEHDVSVVTGHQIMRAFDLEHYEIVPIYITRDGKWYTGDPLHDLKSFRNEVVSLAGVVAVTLSPATNHHGLIVNPSAAGLFAKSTIKRLDVVFPAIHGSHGEDGTLQGLLELADIPYVGCGVMASAIANDKLMTKTVLKMHGIPVVESVSFTRSEWDADPDRIIRLVEDTLPYPCFVKPVTLGSSIGITRAADANTLRTSITIAANLDRHVMVERAVTHPIEVNVSIIGDDRGYQTSVLEQPVSWEEFLTYEEKYLRGGEGMKSAERIIPAPIGDELTARIQDYAKRAFAAIDGRGIARLDFMIQRDDDAIFLNEINTMPGSLAFYLWVETGMQPRDLVVKLVELAQDAHAEKRRSTYDYQTNLIAVTAQRGLKGVKGTKKPTSAN